MKYCRLIWVLFFVLIIKTNAFTQSDSTEYGRLYVASVSGLKVRERPSSKSKQIGFLNYKEVVNAKQVNEIDTIESRISNWYKLNGDVSGYIFGGYLNKNKLPDNDYNNLNEYVPVMISKLKIINKRTFKQLTKGDVLTLEVTNLIVGDNYSLIERESYEYHSKEYYIENLNINEFINLYDIFRHNEGNNESAVTSREHTPNLKSFKYSIEDAGMEYNMVSQLENNVVKLEFRYSP